MDRYKDCVIVYKSGKGVVLRATKLTVQNADKFAVVYDGDSVMAIIPFSEIRTVLFCDVTDADKLIEVLGGEK